jgi:hypothetical protein
VQLLPTIARPYYQPRCRQLNRQGNVASSSTHLLLSPMKSEPALLHWFHCAHVTQSNISMSTPRAASSFCVPRHRRPASRAAPHGIGQVPQLTGARHVGIATGGDDTPSALDSLDFPGGFFYRQPTVVTLYE